MRVSNWRTTRLGRRSPRIAWGVLSLTVLVLLTVIPCMAADEDIILTSPEEVLTINGPVGIEDLFPVSTLAAVVVPAPIKRGFYLTNTSYATNVPLTACAKGYHMASIWELLEVSTLNYHFKHPYAYTKADSGKGPPSFWYGWVRTGYDSSNNSTAGTGNCNNWSSVSGADYGVAVRLTNNWQTSLGAIGPWQATSFTCNYTGPVWCVSNVR